MGSPFEFYKKRLPLIVVLLTVILGIRSSIIEPFRIPTRSMLPGLMTGDFLFANKLRYGFHLPFSEYFGNPIVIGKATNPERGDVIIFSPPEAGQESLYIKRVIGLPGDRISFNGKTVLINGEPLGKIEITGSDRDQILNSRGFDPDHRYDPAKLHLFEESTKTADGSTRTYLTLEDDSYANPNASSEYNVPADHFFVMGDNRDDTRDSRSFGVIALNSIRAQALLIWFSWNLNFERIGKPIR